MRTPYQNSLNSSRVGQFPHNVHNSRLSRFSFIHLIFGLVYGYLLFYGMIELLNCTDCNYLVRIALVFSSLFAGIKMFINICLFLANNLFYRLLSLFLPLFILSLVMVCLWHTTYSTVFIVINFLSFCLEIAYHPDNPYMIRASQQHNDESLLPLIQLAKYTFKNSTVIDQRGNIIQHYECPECCICYQVFEEDETVTVLTCQHMLHYQCAYQCAYQWGKNCPLCRI